LQLVAEKTLLHLVFIGADDIVCGGANIAMSLSWCIYIMYVRVCVCGCHGVLLNPQWRTFIFATIYRRWRRSTLAPICISSPSTSD